ncbi:hypothetical protein [Pseudomonas aeruginosa]|uniref:hypothetical protein n=1 Tax=Pseudomonas aeruginosa TaxID=287 RepID=UPI001BD61C6E|nr:hypothetical protein [Pseudomonas aeruginosa]
MSNTLTLARDRANAFARLHLPECAAELLSWKETSLLPTDGRIRELAKLCAEFTGPVASLGVAEATVFSVALQALTGAQPEVRRFSIDTDGNGAFAEVVLAEDYEHAVLARQSAEAERDQYKAELERLKDQAPVAFMFRGADGRLRMDACRHKPNEAGWEGVFGEPRPAPTPLPTI